MSRIKQSHPKKSLPVMPSLRKKTSKEIKREVLRHYRCMADLGIAFGKDRSYYRFQLWSSCLQGVYAFEKVLGYVTYLLGKHPQQIDVLDNGVWRVHAHDLGKGVTGSAVIVVNPKYLQYGKDKRTGATEPAHGVAVYYWPCENAKRSLGLWDIWTAIVNHFRVFQQGKIAEGTVEDVCAFYEEKRAKMKLIN